MSRVLPSNEGSAPGRSESGPGYRRRKTRTVRLGDLSLGSDHPIRIQSMTTPPTRDTRATVEQIARLVDAGCEIVRVTVPTTADADNLPEIRRELARRGIRVPLVADIHFTPAAALRAVEHVEKIRINPGNFADKKKFAVREYSDDEYAGELVRIARTFSPLVRRAKELGVAMRIGTNHGSLSDRIMNRFGDTPEGMVESALEFVRICEDHDYRELVLSMKASNPVVVLHAYRLLARRMDEQGMDYPIHLGVTEAGDGEDGRIKSATGMGPLLEEGIGDTVRVSLTEDPVREIPVALALVEPFNRRHAGRLARAGGRSIEFLEPLAFRRRPSRELNVGPHVVGGARTVIVEVPLHSALADEAGVRSEIDSQAGVRVPEESRAELFSVALASADESGAMRRLRDSVQRVAPRVALSARVDPAWLDGATDARLREWLDCAHRLHLRVLAGAAPAARMATVRRLLQLAPERGAVLLVEAGSSSGAVRPAVDLATEIAQHDGAARCGLMLALSPLADGSPLEAYRALAAGLEQAACGTPLVLLDRPSERGADPLLGPAAALGGLLCDGIGDAVHVAARDATDSRRLGFGILQAARVRITRTEFISCPSCGRTLFDLEETTARIKSRTAHLKGVKIAIMGCVVNGPGEMADADFGYVGWGEDKIALFVGKEMVARDIPAGQADERLVELIKGHGRWVDPPVPEAEPSGQPAS